MSPSIETPDTAATSQGHAFSEGAYLDLHYEAARAGYEEMARFAGLRPGWAVVDAGAGGGSYLPLLSELVGEGGAIEAIDLAPENVAMIRKRAGGGEFACPVSARAGSVTELPLADNAYDAVWSANVFQYLTDEQLAKALVEFKRVVRPGGRIIVKDSDFSATILGTNPTAFWHLIEGGLSHPELGPLASAYLRTIQLPRLFTRQGIELIDYRTFTCEWRYPLRPVDVAYLKTSIPNYGAVGATLDLPEKEAALWRRCLDPDAADSYLHASDFYYREAFMVIVGQRPLKADG